MKSPLGAARSLRSPLGTTPINLVTSPWLAGGATGCVAAYQPKGAANLAASYVNLANPGTYNCTLGIAPTWDAVNGWAFNGTAYLKTGVIPAAGWSALIQFSGTGTVGAGFIFGEFVTNAAMLVSPNFTGAVTRYYNGGVKAGSAGLAAGNLGVSGQTAYYNGVGESGAIPAWTGGPAVEIYIGGYNLAGSPTSRRACNIQALYIYDATSNLPANPAIVAAVVAEMGAL